MSKKVISQFKELPKTKFAWWAMGLGLAALFSGPMLGISAAFLVPMIETVFGDPVSAIVGSSVALAVFALVIFALSLSIRAFRIGERSWVVWVGFVPSAFASVMLLLLIIGEFVVPH